jgi:hypothetical protein
MKILRMYDFDDTLAVSKGVIRLFRDGEETVFLSHEYTKYRPVAGDELCFSDLNHLREVRLIRDRWSQFTHEAGQTDHEVRIITSRPPGAASAIRKLLGLMGVQGVGVMAIGSMDKVGAVSSIVNSGRYKSAYFVDDNIRLVGEVKSYLDSLSKETHTIESVTTEVQPHLPAHGDHLSELMGDFMSDDYEVCRVKIR